MITFEDIEKVNSGIRTMTIERKDKKTGTVTTKEYAEVNEKVKAFRKLFPNGCISTSIESLENGVVVMKTLVSDEEGHLLSTGYAYEKESNGFINANSFIENCETSAVGRALSFIALGIDTSIASYEEVANAIEQGKPKNENPVTPKMIKDIQDLVTRQGKTLDGLLKWAGINDITKMTQAQYEELMKCKKG